MKRWSKYCCCFLLLFLGKTAWAQRVHDTQESILAKILLQLPHYILFEAAHPAPNLCILNNIELKEKADLLNQKNHTYDQVSAADINNLTGCTYLYIDERSAARSLIGAPQKNIMFLISNYPSFIDEGGAVAIIDNHGRIEMHLNLTAAKDQKANFSPDLIDISKRVIQ